MWYSLVVEVVDLLHVPKQDVFVSTQFLGHQMEQVYVVHLVRVALNIQHDGEEWAMTADIHRIIAKREKLYN